MKLVLLGTAGYHPTQRRHTSCLMLPEMGVVLDAGTGMFRIRELIQTPTLDIFLTHSHLDHVVGLTFLLDVLPKKSLERVTVHALPEKLAAIDEHLLSQHIFPVKLPCEMRPLAPTVPAGRRRRAAALSAGASQADRWVSGSTGQSIRSLT